jgi:squalene-hopene/tetraprenyl-beta-curcumene cyclase
MARGLAWLASHANADGGWGDTIKSFSNLSTTTLCWAAFGVVPGADEKYCSVVANAERWLTEHAGGITPERLAPAIIARYGKDRTFSVPILTMCALAGRLGAERRAWRWVLPLPFELAACPHAWFAALRLPVVSYALPALIAIGQARHHHRPTRNLPLRWLRAFTRDRTLGMLAAIQPSSGGFLEATPLTSFVTMSLAGSGRAEHPVVKRGVEFLLASARADGSWPIDTNLSTWVTTLAVNALANDPHETLPPDERRAIREWLLAQQSQCAHPYTRAAPGGWAWTHLPGGVPDADDTAGALLALKNLGDIDDRVRDAAIKGVNWLLNLQNADGGIPTFCRGWTNLPFDRSGPDLTAHALRAWLAWLDESPPSLQRRLLKRFASTQRYLARSKAPAGNWHPLWFGNQHCSDEANVTYGTAKVLLALREAWLKELSTVGWLLRDAVRHFFETQNDDGGWGGGAGTPSSVEETALAVEAAAALWETDDVPKFARPEKERLLRGVTWLVERVENGQWTEPAPIGFYFAKLWYYEKLYPMSFTVGALGRAARALALDR